MFLNGIKLDITFKGGSILKYSFTGQIDLAKAESAISKAIGIDVTCQETHALGSGERNRVINVAGDEALTPDQQIALQQALETTFPDTTFKYGNALMVNPFIGRELFTKGLWAILITSVLIVAYVWFSFRSMSDLPPALWLWWRFSRCRGCLFVFVICRIPINESLVAVVLSILGFSINDTIVIYDRIRENERLTAKKMPLADLVDLSINQSLSRSINTSLCTFGAVTVAYIFSVIYDIPSIQHFALPMMIGLISGAYSSIALAGPLWVMWKTRKGRSGYEGR